MSNVFNGFEQLSAMKQFSKSMRELADAVKEANLLHSSQGDTSLAERAKQLEETVNVIEETEQKLRQFHTGAITLEELEAFRDQVAAKRPTA